MRNDYDELETYNHNNDDYNEYGGHREMTMTYDDLDRLVSSKVRGSMMWMLLGLVITGLFGFFVYNGLMTGNPIAIGIIRMYYVLAVIEVIVVVAFSALIYKAKSSTLKLMFLIYSALNGLTLSAIGIIYAPSVVISAFLGTLVLIVLVSLVNIFLRNSGLDLFVSVLGVIVFTIFIAVDVNRIKSNIIAYAVQEDSEILNKIEISGALSLYLDFVNLFLSILRISGRGRN